MSRYLKAFLILSLLLAPARAQSGLQVTQGVVVAGGGGVSSQGSFSVEGTVGQPSAGSQPAGGGSGGGTFSLYGGFFTPAPLPFVQSIVRAGANPALQNSSVGYVVTFNVPVTGVDAADFQLTTAGLTGASVTGVSGSGATYDVTVNTGTPSSAGATLRLDVVDDDTVVDAESVALGGAGAGNGNYTSGEVYAVALIGVRVNDAAAAEPASGSAQMLFTVTLGSAAPAGGLALGYATADGGATPATGGASCGGAVDYLTTGGTLSFSAGERVKTVSVGVCADSSGPETNETLLLNISGASTGSIDDGQATGTITQGTAAGTFVISELRTSGPAGAADDFVEFYNNTDAPLVVAASDASGGYGVFKMGTSCADTPVLVGTIPNGTSIPARGHYLAVGTAYSLAGYGGTGAAAGDLTLTSDIESDRNVAVFTTNDPGAVSTARRLDAVGFGAHAGGVCDLLREGNTLAPVSGSTAEHSYFRKECDFIGGVGCATPGHPKETNDNSSDFMFADTQATLINGVQQRLGAPGPENLSSPVRRDNSGVGVALLDGSAPSSAPPNRVRGFTSEPGNNSTFGTLTVRRRVVNNTGGDVTRLRFRIVEMTTYPSPAGTADLRARTSVDEVSVGPIKDAGTCATAGAGPPPCSVTVRGLTLEESPSQTYGGGINSTLAAGMVTLETPLADGASLPVSFLLGVQTTGTFRFYLIVEALP